MFKANDYVIYTTSNNKKFIAVVDGLSSVFEGSVYITLLNSGEKIVTHKNSLETIKSYIIPGDYISVVDISLDTLDRDWFNDLYNRYIKITG